MPLPPELENLLSKIEDEKEREATRVKLTEAHENGLRQADYSRKMNELKEKTTKWTQWHETADKQYRDAVSESEALKVKVAELEKAKGRQDSIDTDPDLTGLEDEAIAKALKATKLELAESLAKQEELRQTITTFQDDLKAGKIITAERFEEELTKRGDNLGAAIFDVIDLQQQCVADYGKTLDRAVLIAEAQKRGGDLKGAYESLTKDFEKEKLRKEIEAEYEQKYNERLKTSNLQVDQGGGGEPTLGPLQTRLAQLQKKEGENESSIPDNIPADGSGRLGTLAGRELREEGKF